MSLPPSFRAGDLLTGATHMVGKFRCFLIGSLLVLSPGLAVANEEGDALLKSIRQPYISHPCITAVYRVKGQRIFGAEGPDQVGEGICELETSGFQRHRLFVTSQTSNYLWKEWRSGDVYAYLLDTDKDRRTVADKNGEIPGVQINRLENGKVIGGDLFMWYWPMYLLEKPASLSGWELRADAAGMKLVLVQPEQKVTYELFLSADHKSLTKWTVLQTDIPDEGEWLNEFTYDAYVDIEGVSIPVKGRRASFVGSNRAHYSTVEYDGTGTILRTVPTFSTIGPELFPNGAHFIDTIKDKEYTVGKPLTSPLNRAGDTASRQPAAKTSAELLSTGGGPPLSVQPPKSYAMWIYVAIGIAILVAAVVGKKLRA